MPACAGRGSGYTSGRRRERSPLRRYFGHVRGHCAALAVAADSCGVAIRPPADVVYLVPVSGGTIAVADVRGRIAGCARRRGLALVACRAGARARLRPCAAHTRRCTLGRGGAPGCPTTGRRAGCRLGYRIYPAWSGLMVSVTNVSSCVLARIYSRSRFWARRRPRALGFARGRPRPTARARLGADPGARP